jgi:hypothetical protein
MATIWLYNTGKRTWLKGQTRGLVADLAPGGSQEIEEVDARRLVMSYPSDFSLVGRAVPSSAELERREQSLKDREANLKQRESDLDAREQSLKDREKALGGSLTDHLVDAEKFFGEIPEDAEKLAADIFAACYSDATDEHPAGFDSKKAAAMIKAFVDKNGKPDAPAMDKEHDPAGPAGGAAKRPYTKRTATAPTAAKKKAAE